MDFRPNRSSSRWERLNPYSNSDGSMSSLCVVNGSACQAMSPASIACSISRRRLAEALSIYSQTSHEPTVQMNRSPPSDRISRESESDDGTNSSTYRRITFRARSVNPTSRCVLKTTCKVGVGELITVTLRLFAILPGGLEREVKSADQRQVASGRP